MKISLERSGGNVVICDGTHKIAFSEKAGPTRLAGIFRNGRNWLGGESELWRIEFIDHGNTVVTCANESAADISIDGDSAHLRWGQIPVKDFGSVSVTVRLVFQGKGQAEWRIRIENVPAELAVYRVFFPFFDLALEDSADYAWTAPVDTGVNYRNPLRTIPMGGIYEKKKIRERAYPNGNITMQFVALEAKDELLYIGAHDTTAGIKTFNYVPDLNAKCLHFDPSVFPVLKFGDSYESFPWVTCLTQGDWYDAAQIYRSFAVTAPWARKGPLEHGDKTPQWYQNCPIVSLRLLRGPGHEAEDLIAESEYFGVPMVVHYYMWHRTAFDAGNPFFFPTVPGFRAVVKRLQQHQVHVMPYVNPYSCDTSLPEWEQGLSNTAMKIRPDGQMGLSVWSQGRSFAAMCPGAALWRRLVNLLALRTLEMGVEALYFDEVGASPAHPCYAQDHGHVPGGGSNYVDAYSTMLGDIRREAKDFNPSLIFASESCCEPLLHHMDSFLMGNGNNPQGIPLFQAVYHDYVMGFGRYVFTVELTDSRFKGAVISKFAQQFIWGCQFGWSNMPLNGYIRKDPQTAEFLKHLAHIWARNSKYFACGRMLRPLDLSNQVETVKRRWAMAWNDDEGTVVDLPAVMNAVWQVDDGSIAVTLVNITETEKRLKIKLASYQDMLAEAMATGKTLDAASVSASKGFYPMPQITIGILRTTKGSTQIESICDGDSEHGFDVTIPALNSVVIIISSEKDYGVH